MSLINREALIAEYDRVHVGVPGGARKLMVDAPEVKPEQKWIPVTERLPEDGTWNIFSDGETISVERYKMDAIDHFFPQGRWFSFDEAIAWMPLPEPYKQQESEGK